jgi:hypothetical protein
MPMGFYGSVTLNGAPAPVGTRVDARVAGARWGVDTNPLEVRVPGNYGSPVPWGPKLVLQGHIDHEATVSLFVDGVRADQTTSFRTGTNMQLDLTASGPPEPWPQPGSATVINWDGALLSGDPLDAEYTDRVLREAYRRRTLPPMWEQIKGDDTFALGMALGLGMPVSDRWTIIPNALQAFVNGVLIVPMGIIL